MAVPLDLIRREAQRIQVARILATALMAPLYVLGWLIGKGALAVAFILAAVKVGWQDARGSAR